MKLVVKEDVLQRVIKFVEGQLVPMKVVAKGQTKQTVCSHASHHHCVPVDPLQFNIIIMIRTGCHEREFGQCGSVQHNILNIINDEVTVKVLHTFHISSKGNVNINRIAFSDFDHFSLSTRNLPGWKVPDNQ